MNGITVYTVRCHECDKNTNRYQNVLIFDDSCQVAGDEYPVPVCYGCLAAGVILDNRRIK